MGLLVSRSVGRQRVYRPFCHFFGLFSLRCPSRIPSDQFCRNLALKVEIDSSSKESEWNDFQKSSSFCAYNARFGLNCRKSRMLLCRGRDEKNREWENLIASPTNQQKPTGWPTRRETDTMVSIAYKTECVSMSIYMPEIMSLRCLLVRINRF